MKNREFTEAIQKVADTSPKKSAVTATDVSRVESLVFRTLALMPAPQAMAVIASKLKLASGRNAKDDADTKALKRLIKMSLK